MSYTSEPDTVERSRQIKEGLEPFVNTGALAGAVAVVADKNGVLGSSAVGWADIAAGEPMQPDSFFWIASQTKPITATALMMLVEEGRVRLDDPLENYLPMLKDPWVIEEQDSAHLLLRKADRPTTVRDTLRHTSGIGAALNPALEEPTLDRLSLEEAVRSYAAMPLEFQPGSQYQYSNAGMNTAGRVIEVVSGISYAEFLQQRLFDPLG
ncbi:MAG: serine hydrolase domain-containing protein, partial [Janthinobacterium lividum]